ncbi:hypothetical protein FQN54_006599 [Arachnomyces sp. PD_36]|nr:hypothetical protein FQN54_006599 [Arachnomyces sp. PD_36]
MTMDQSNGESLADMNSLVPISLPKHGPGALARLPSELFQMILDQTFSFGWWGGDFFDEMEEEAHLLRLRLVCKRFDSQILYAAYKHDEIIESLGCKYTDTEPILARLLVERTRSSRRRSCPLNPIESAAYAISTAAAQLDTHVPNCGIEPWAGYLYGLANAAGFYYGTHSLAQHLLRHREGNRIGTTEGAHETSFERCTNDDILVAAAACNNSSLCKRMLQEGAKVNYVSPYFGSVIHAAVFQGHVETVRMALEQMDLDVNARNPNASRTPLLVAVDRGHEAVVKELLMRADTDPELSDNYGYTPLRLACMKHLEGIVRLLIERPDIDINRGYMLGVTALDHAVSPRHSVIIQLILKRTDLNVSALDRHGVTLFTRVLSKLETPDLDILQLLVDRDNSVLNKASEWKTSPLWVCLSQNRIQGASFLLSQNDTNVGVRDDQGRTILHEASRRGNEAMVREILRCGRLDPNIKAGEYKMTPLHEALTRPSPAVVKALLEHSQVDVNSTRYDGCTPLARAVSANSRGNLEVESIIKSLLDREDINVDLPGHDGQPPLYLAACHGCEKRLKLLLAHGGVDPSRRDMDGKTPLFAAITFGRLSAVRLLLDQRGVDANVKAKNGRSPLLSAATMMCAESLDITRLLLARPEVDTTYRDSGGHDAFFLAGLWGNLPMMKMLLDEYGFDPNVQDFQGMTLLHYAISRENGVLKYLLGRGDVVIGVKDFSGHTALDYAVKSGNTSAVQLLSGADESEA